MFSLIEIPAESSDALLIRLPVAKLCIAVCKERWFALIAFLAANELTFVLITVMFKAPLIETAKSQLALAWLRVQVSYQLLEQ
jgi:hypothetical protein